MAVSSTGSAHWEGSLEQGGGSARLASSQLAEVPVNWTARSAGAAGMATPEELLGAAHAACYAMALSHAAGQRGLTPSGIDATSEVTFQPGTGITGIVLTVTAAIPGLTAEEFTQLATEVSTGCPVSAALSAVPITLARATLQA